MKLPKLPAGFPVFTAVVIALLLLGWILTRTSTGRTPEWLGGGPAPLESSSSPARPSARSAAAPTPSYPTGPTGASGLPTCEFASIPKEASDTARLVRAGGPFPYPRNDAATFFNNGKLLPVEKRGYYREYTVRTPGASNRGQRRLVTGGEPATNPPHWYYTGDHYLSFCELAGTD